jgi:geranylgeranyl pyrophosphate synthase
VKKSIASELARPSINSGGGAIEADLAAVEERLSSLLDSNETHLAEICHYLIDGSGKRLRPTFILLVHRACGGSERTIGDAIDAATALELIHSATLLHDDIIDGGVLRRGRPSAYARFGPAPTLVAGDYLFCRAFEICGRFDEPLVLTAARACIQLTEGEAMEGRLRYNAGTSLEEYLAVITRKTASLFAAGGKVAADLAGAPAAVGEAMSRLGNAVGLAFQMVDDLLDVLGPEETIGKPVGSDIRAGIPSLPMVLAAEHNPDLRAMFGNGAAHDDAIFNRMLELLREPSIIARARALAAEQVQRARELLTTLRPSAYRDRLSAVIDEQVRREV